MLLTAFWYDFTKNVAYIIDKIICYDLNFLFLIKILSIKNSKKAILLSVYLNFGSIIRKIMYYTKLKNILKFLQEIVLHVWIISIYIKSKWKMKFTKKFEKCHNILIFLIYFVLSHVFILCIWICFPSIL